MKVTIKRWIDLFVLLIVSLGLYLIFSYQFFKFFVGLNNYFGLWSEWIILILKAVIYVVLILLLFKTKVIRFMDFNPFHLIKYPPVWIVTLVGSLLFLLLAVEHNTFFNRHTLNGINLFIIVIKICMPFILLYIIISIVYFLSFYINDEKRRKRVQESSSEGSIISNPNNFLEWIIDDEPISHPKSDLFGLTSMAERCTDLLLQENISSIGINGPYGSGKSSILKLIKHFLQDDAFRRHGEFRGKIEVITIGGWGRDESTIDQQILSRIVDVLSKYVDCLSISGLPKRYKNALLGTNNSIVNVLSSILYHSADPKRSLKKLDEILSSINLRIILFIEDIDRNEPSDVELGSLLDRLKKLSNVSYIITLGLAHEYEEIVNRVCDQIESLS